MNNINSTNNVTFNARMNIQKMKVDKARWNNIAKIFEEKTAKNRPNEVVFELSQKSKTRNGVLIDSENYLSEFGCITANAYSKLMQLTDEQIANKFKKLLTLITKPSDTANKIANQVAKHIDTATDLDCKVYDAISSSLENKSYNQIEKDKHLRNWNITMY